MRHERGNFVASLPWRSARPRGWSERRVPGEPAPSPRPEKTVTAPPAHSGHLASRGRATPPRDAGATPAEATNHSATGAQGDDDGRRERETCVRRPVRGRLGPRARRRRARRPNGRAVALDLYCASEPDEAAELIADRLSLAVARTGVSDQDVDQDVAIRAGIARACGVSAGWLAFGRAAREAPADVGRGYEGRDRRRRRDPRGGPAGDVWRHPSLVA